MYDLWIEYYDRSGSETANKISTATSASQATHMTHSGEHLDRTDSTTET